VWLDQWAFSTPSDNRRIFERRLLSSLLEKSERVLSLIFLILISIIILERLSRRRLFNSFLKFINRLRGWISLPELHLRSLGVLPRQHNSLGNKSLGGRRVTKLQGLVVFIPDTYSWLQMSLELFLWKEHVLPILSTPEYLLSWVLLFPKSITFAFTNMPL
jgi:hypothetical protein